MTNVFAVVLRFAEPFTDVAFSKVDKVDPDYFVKSARIDLGDVTRLRATQAEADEYATAYRAAHAEGAEGSAPPPNFISDVFWLACAVQHVGLCKTVGTRTELERKIGDVERDVQRLEADDSWRTGGGPVREQGEALMKKLKVRAPFALAPCPYSHSQRQPPPPLPGFDPPGPAQVDPRLAPRVRRPAARPRPGRAHDGVPDARHGLVCPARRPGRGLPGADDHVRPRPSSLLSLSGSRSPCLSPSPPVLARCPSTSADGLQADARTRCPLSARPRLPLPDEAPLNFRMLPEYILEDIADYHVFLISCVPASPSSRLSCSLPLRPAHRPRDDRPAGTRPRRSTRPTRPSSSRLSSRS